MGASLEALAMAGADYVDSAIDFDTLDEEIPPYLLAIDHEEDEPMDDEKKKKMGTSLEAIAMAGADYVDHAIDQGKECEDVKQIDVGKKKKKEMSGSEETKALLLLWAKMVASSIRRKLAD
ncbi:hypothetical protein GW17_00019235 [Ensete ventricosum]|nr:hypothetical protein GW17_00019235 [Ensete ventricosum]